MTKIFQADCDEFDDSKTGFYATEQDAIDAFWNENRFSDAERKRVTVYAREKEIDSDVIDEAYFLDRQGSPSPAITQEMTIAEIDRLIRTECSGDAEVCHSAAEIFAQLPLTLADNHDCWEFAELVRCAAHDLYREEHDIEIK